MGGNTLAYDKHSKTHTRADEINLEVIGVDNFRKTIDSLMAELHKEFKEKFHKDLYDEESYKQKPYKFFGGSSSLAMNNGYDAKSVLKIKQRIGDLDIFIRVSNFEEFTKVLDSLEGKHITPNIKYKGYNRSNALGLFNQRHCIFEFDFGLGLIFNFQVDFIGVPFVQGFPNYFTRFVSVTMTQDLRRGFKGLAKNALIECLFKLKFCKKDVVVVKANSTPEKYRVNRQINDICLYEFRNDLGVVKRFEEFKDDSGNLIEIEGKPAYIELALSKENITNQVKDIYGLLFVDGYTKNQKSLRSYKEFVPLLKGLLTRDEIHELHDIFIKKLWCHENRYRCSYDPLEDTDIKTKIYDYFIKTLNLKDNSYLSKQAFYEYF